MTLMIVYAFALFGIIGFSIYIVQTSNLEKILKYKIVNILITVLVIAAFIFLLLSAYLGEK